MHQLQPLTKIQMTRLAFAATLLNACVSALPVSWDNAIDPSPKLVPDNKERRESWSDKESISF